MPPDILHDRPGRVKLSVPHRNPTAHFNPETGELTVKFFQHRVDFDLIRQSLKSARADFVGDGSQIKTITVWASPEASQEPYGLYAFEAGFRTCPARRPTLLLAEDVEAAQEGRMSVTKVEAPQPQPAVKPEPVPEPSVSRPTITSQEIHDRVMGKMEMPE